MIKNNADVFIKKISKYKICSKKSALKKYRHKGY